MKGDDGAVMALRDLLAEADLLSYEEAMRSKLKLRHALDLKFATEADLDAIEMSRPEQRRLRKAFVRHFPSSIVGKLKKRLKGSLETDKLGDKVTPVELDQHVIPRERITTCKKLGEGEFGAVFQGFWNNGRERVQVAVKVVTQDKLLANPSAFLQEAAIMHRVHHENIVHLYGVVLEPKSYMLVSELAPLSSLLECVRASALRSSFSVEVLCSYAEQIARGMAYLEHSRLIHRDLAARNVLVFSADRVKISDFGLSRSLGVGEDYYRAVFCHELRLPLAWCAPESISFLRFTSSSDCWAFAVTLWEAFSYGLQPWLGFTGAQILEAIDLPRCERLPRPEACPADFYELILRCWAHDPGDRPTFAQLVTLLPDMQPQCLIAISACADLQPDHLQYSQNDLIIVLDKTPREYPDGYYWRGALKNGRIGLFRPSNTVAFLGADLPSSGVPLSGGEKKKQRPVISEPQDDLRHTCHVGPDGSSFGLLNLDKKHLATSQPAPSANRLQQPPQCPLQGSPGSTKIPSAPPLTLKPRAPTPPLPVCMQPPLPPKPAKPTTISPVPTTTSASSPTTSDTIFLELPTCSMNGHVSRSPLEIDQTDSTIFSDLQFPDEIFIDEVFNALNDDLTDFSISTFGDVSDQRPLITDRHTNGLPPRGDKSVVRPMSQAELHKWTEKMEKAHRNVDKRLDKHIERAFGKTTANSESLPSRVNSLKKRLLNNGCGNGDTMSKSFSDSLPSKTAVLDEQWSEEAQAAYKLLVQCGQGLQRGGDRQTSLNSTDGSRRAAAITVARSVSDQPSKRLPPPVPPKPMKAATVNGPRMAPYSSLDHYCSEEARERRVGATFAPAVASASLFTSATNDEIMHL